MLKMWPIYLKMYLGQFWQKYGFCPPKTYVNLHVNLRDKSGFSTLLTMANLASKGRILNCLEIFLTTINNIFWYRCSRHGCVSCTPMHFFFYVTGVFIKLFLMGVLRF